MAKKNAEVLNVDIVVEFFEVAIHCILYNRDLYPQGVFEKRKKYNVPVQMCLHPDVSAYISDIIKSLGMLLKAGRVDYVAVVIMREEDCSPVEKFVFELGKLKDNWKESDPHLFRVEQALRGFLLKLNVTDALLKQKTQDCTWTVHAHTNDSTLCEVEQSFIRMDFPWAEADEKEKEVVNAKIIPVKSIKTDIFDMQLYVEEEGAKASVDVSNMSMSLPSLSASMEEEGLFPLT